MSNFADDVPPLADGASALHSADSDLDAKEISHEHDANFLFGDTLPKDIAAARAELRGRVSDIPVEIEVVIGRTKISVSDLMRVDPDHIFQLDKRFGEPVELLINGRLIGYGEIVADSYDNAIGIRMVRLAG